VARLIPVLHDERRPGRLVGQIRLHDDFDAPLPPELAEAFGTESE
jgi:hypothetical protein